MFFALAFYIGKCSFRNASCLKSRCLVDSHGQIRQTVPNVCKGKTLKSTGLSVSTTTCNTFVSTCEEGGPGTALGIELHHGPFASV